VPKKKLVRKSAPKSKKKPARPKKLALKKKPLKKKPARGKNTAANSATAEVFEVELTGGPGNLLVDEDNDEINEEDFPQEYGGSE
jgi:hypothetical protein